MTSVEVADAGDTEAVTRPDALSESSPLPHEKATQHVRVMDGLRGLAILLVLMFHYWQLSWWVIPIPGLSRENNLEFIQFCGSLGVALFFFISAFCLFYPHAKAMFGQGPVPGLRHFYYRRFIKIVPSYLLALAVFGIFFSNLYSVTFKYGTMADLGLHLTFLHNLFPDTRSSFDGVLWSLGVEVQFYYLFPLLAWLFRRRPWATTGGMVGVAVLWRAWVRGKDVNVFAHWDHQLPGFFDLFACGMLAAYLVVWLRQRSQVTFRLRYIFTGLAVVSVIILGYMFEWGYDLRWRDYAFDVWQSEDKQWLAALFLCIAVLSIYSIRFWQAIIANPVLIFLSTISYNLYIWHQAVGLLIRDRHWWASSKEPPMGDPHWQWTYMIVAVGASIGLATLVTYCFERPLLHHGVRGALALAGQRLRGGLDIAAGRRIGKRPWMSTETNIEDQQVSRPALQVSVGELGARIKRFAGRLHAAPGWHAPLVGLLGFASSVIAGGFRHAGMDNNVRLADAFNHGRLWIYLPDLYSYIDAQPYRGTHYVIEGPLPSVLLMPFVAIFGKDFNQELLAAALAGVALAAAWTVCRRLELAIRPTAILVGFLLFGTDLLWCAASGDVWFLAHVSAVAFTMLALAELLGERRGWLVGLWAVCAFESRFSLAVVIPVYVYLLLTRDEQPLALVYAWRKRLASIGAVGAVAGVLWLSYNHARWGTFSDVGYTLWYQHDFSGVGGGSPFQLRFLQHQLYSFFIQEPEFHPGYPWVRPTIGGQALVWTSPALALAFLARKPKRLVLAMWAAAILAAVPNFLYYVNGFSQFGMRHALDFEPFLFVLMALGVKAKFPRWGYILSAVSIVVGIWGCWYWYVYLPH